MNSILLVSLLTLGLLGAVMLMLPWLSPRRYYFGLTVAPEFRESEEGRAIGRRYLYSVVAALAAAVALAITLREASMLIAILAVLVAGLAAFFYARAQVRRFAGPGAAVREAELGRPEDHLPWWAFFALPPFAVPLAIGAYLNAHWNEIPARFPVHWGWNGEPNRWAPRTPHAVFGPLWFGGVVMLLLIVMAAALFYGARRSPWRIAILKILIAAVSMVAIVFAMVGLLPLWRLPMVMWVLPPLAFVAIVLVYVAKLTSDPSLPADATPDACWRLSMIYYNRADAALFVQKRIGFGYTINFGNPAAWVFLSAILAIPLAAIFLLR